MILLAIPFLNLRLLRKRQYETTLNLHRCLSAAALVATWLHLPPSSGWGTPRIYVLLIATSLVSLKCIATAATIFQGRGRAEIHQIAGLSEVRLRLSRHRDFRAGQYVYICIPGLRITRASFLQSHPFQIAWCYRDEDGHDVVVLLVETRSGFTRDLELAAKSKRKHLALIDGPYGYHPKVDQFGTVILFASGIGITGQLMAMKELVTLFSSCDAKARRFVLFWDIEAESENDHPQSPNLLLTRASPSLLGQRLDG